MNDFKRQPCRTNIQPLRSNMTPELELRLQLEQQIRDNAIAEFNREERRLTNRVTRVLRGFGLAARETVKIAWQALEGR